MVDNLGGLTLPRNSVVIMLSILAHNFNSVKDRMMELSQIS